MTPQFRRNLAALALGGAAALLGLLLQWGDWLRELEWKSFDLRVRLLNTEIPPPPELAVILVDEASLKLMNPLLGRWPWPRSVHADLVDFLAVGGARAIAFDILFTENERILGERSDLLGANDRRLADAVAGAGNVFSAMQLVHDEEDEFNRSLLGRPLPGDFVSRFGLDTPSSQGQVSSNNFYLPYEELTRATHGVGVVEFSPDRDGVYRRTRLMRWYDATALPVMSLAILLDSTRMLPPSSEQLLLQTRDGAEIFSIPLQQDGSFLIKPYRSFRPYSVGGVLASAQKLIQGETEGLPIHPDEFRDKIVLIGASAVGVEDLKPTPYGDLAPGVYLHASILGNILQRDFLHTPPGALSLLLAVALPLAMVAGVLLTSRSGLRLVIPPLLLLGFIAAALLAFRHNLVLDTIPPLTGMSVGWLGSFAWLSATEGRDKRRIRKMLGQYVSPTVLETLIDQSADGVLRAEVGRREELTILFSDIRGFTTLSEALEPEQVVEILNGYFSGMVDIIFLHQGTLDKFIGDAIMAFWGAPLRVNDHPRRAVEAALTMTRWLESYNTVLAERNLKPLAIGIGLHSGPVILGNIGSEKKLDYTIIGDNVNLCSRLEGLTKPYGCSVLVSESTRDALGDDYPCRIVDAVRVKGKTRPVRIFEPLASPADPPELFDKAQREMTQTDAAFTRYLERDWAGAALAYAKLLEAKPGDRLAELFMERCQQYAQYPPAADWDGVFTLQSK